MRPVRVSVDEAVARIARLVPPVLIAIDGLPFAGKSTLVETIGRAVDMDCIYLDEFVRPESDWPSSRSRPKHGRSDWSNQ